MTMLFTLAKLDARILIPIGFGVLVVAILVMAIMADRKRREGVAAWLRERGFEVLSKPSKEDRPALFAPFDGLTPLRHGAKGLRWLARGRVAGNDVIICEHAYTVQRGKNSHTVVNCCVAIPCAASWPMLTLHAESWFDRFGERLGGKPDVRVESPEFNKRWRVRCEDDGFAIAVLSPELQDFLAAADRREWWAIGGLSRGLVCVGHTRSPKPQLVAAMLDRLQLAIAAMPEQARAGLGVPASRA